MKTISLQYNVGGGMNSIQYVIAYIFPILAFWSLGEGGLSLWSIPVFTFVIIPVLETFFVGTQDNLSDEEMKKLQVHY